MILTDKCKLRIVLSPRVSHVLRIDGADRIVGINVALRRIIGSEGFSHGLSSHTAWWEDVQHDTDQ